MDKPMSEADRLAEIRDVWEHAKHRNEEGKYASLPDTVVDDTLLAFAEIDRLRGLLARLEWARDAYPGADGGSCPVCRGGNGHHHPDCWLAAELR